jgi:Clr5 domain
MVSDLRDNISTVEAPAPGMMELPYRDLERTKDGTCPQQIHFMNIEPRPSFDFGVATNHANDVTSLNCSLQLMSGNETTEMTTGRNHVPFLLSYSQATPVNVSGPGNVSTFNSTDGRQAVTASEFQKQDQVLPVPRRPPTTEDWNAYRAIFTTLYLEEKKTLGQTKEIMRNRYGFHASYVNVLALFVAP